jgi:predicted esterase
VEEVIRGVLREKCGYAGQDVVLFGFGQGGMVALGCAVEMGTEQELGGVVSIGGGVPRDVKMPGTKIRTPVIVCKGSRKSGVSDEDVDRVKEVFEFVEVKEWAKTGDGMPSSREEMLPIMQFFARRMRSLRGVPKGSLEIT